MPEPVVITIPGIAKDARRIAAEIAKELRRRVLHPIQDRILARRLRKMSPADLAAMRRDLDAQMKNMEAFGERFDEALSKGGALSKQDWLKFLSDGADFLDEFNKLPPKEEK